MIEDPEVTVADAREILGQCISCSKERQKFVADLVIERLTRFLIEKDEATSSTIAKALSNPDWYGYSRRFSGGGIRSEIVYAIREKAKAEILRRSNSKYFAQLAWVWYGELNANSLAKFGLGAFWNAPQLDDGVPVDGFSFALMNVFDSNIYWGSRLPQNGFRAGLAAIGRFGALSAPVPIADFIEPGFVEFRYHFGHSLPEIEKAALPKDQAAGVIFVMLLDFGLRRFTRDGKRGHYDEKRQRAFMNYLKRLATRHDLAKDAQFAKLNELIRGSIPIIDGETSTQEQAADEPAFIFPLSAFTRS